MFIVYTIIVLTCPVITDWDKSIILFVQSKLKNLPLFIPLLPDCMLYTLMIIFPLGLSSVYFLKKRELLKVIYICSIPIITFFLNCIIKPVVSRLRPDESMQLIVHPHSYSYVSSHSLVTMTLYGLIIYYFFKYNKNNLIKYPVIVLSVLWILFVGLSRVWLGVHYPSDVLGAYLLGFILCTIYSKIHIL